MARPPAPPNTAQYKIRFDNALREQVDIAAERNRTSRNQEIVSRLENSFRNDPLVRLTNEIKKLVRLHGGG